MKLQSLSIAAGLALLIGIAGCEQRPADTDPPPTRPGETEPDAPPPRQPLGQRSDSEQSPAAGAPAAQQNTETSVAAAATGGRARAELMPTQGNQARGTVEFVQEGAVLHITAQLTGLPPGDHAIHVHENGDCSAPDGKSAGPHFAPDGDPHGSPMAGHDQHHLGDLGNIRADESGEAMLTTEDDELQLTGEYGVVGRAVVVHANADDFQTQPDGNSGDPIACGVIELVSDSIDRG